MSVRNRRENIWTCETMPFVIAAFNVACSRNLSRNKRSQSFRPNFHHSGLDFGFQLLKAHSNAQASNHPTPQSRFFPGDLVWETIAINVRNSEELGRTKGVAELPTNRTSEDLIGTQQSFGSQWHVVPASFNSLMIGPEGGEVLGYGQVPLSDSSQPLQFPLPSSCGPG